MRLLIALAVVAALTLPAQAAQTLTVSSQYGSGKPQTLFWERFAERLEAARPGRYDVRIVISGALGGEKEEAEAIRIGALQGALSTVANLTTWVPQGAVLDLPFVFSDRAHIARALDGPLGAELKAAYRAQGFEVPAFIVFGARHLVGQGPITEPSALEGLTMRALQSDLHVALWRHFGAEPTALPITEAYGALASGVVDAMDMTKSGYEALKLYEVAPVLSETSHIYAIGVVYFDAAFWEGLGASERSLFQRLAADAAGYFNELTAAEQDEAMTRARQAGAHMEVVDLAPWRAAVADFVAGYVKGGEGLADALAAVEATR